MSDPHAHRSASDGIKRGFLRRCPNCGEGHLFSGYLAVEPACEACGHENARYRADDGPAYFTILLVGQLVVAPLLLFPVIWKTPAAVIVPATLIPLFFLTLVALPRVKGAVIGLLYALNVNRGDAALHTADRFD